MRIIRGVENASRIQFDAVLGTSNKRAATIPQIHFRYATSRSIALGVSMIRWLLHPVMPLSLWNSGSRVTLESRYRPNFIARPSLATCSIMSRVGGGGMNPGGIIPPIMPPPVESGGSAARFSGESRAKLCIV